VRWRCAADIPGEGYTFDIDRVDIAAADNGDNMAFIGHMQNFIVDNVTIIELLQSHDSTDPDDDSSPALHSVLANTGILTYRELPIPVHPVTLTAGSVDMTYLDLPTFNLSQGNATLKMMFKTLVSVQCDHKVVFVSQLGRFSLSYRLK